MSDQLLYPWRLATNERYRDVVKTLMTLSTASLFLPVFFAREFLGIKGEIPLKSVVGCSVYVSWGMLGLALFSGIVFHFLSAKWIRFAWGQPANILGISTSECFVERALELSFWVTVIAFMVGLGMILAFLFGYGGKP